MKTELDFERWVRERKAASATPPEDPRRSSASKDDTVGEAVFRHLEAETIVDTDGWTVELVERVAARVQAPDPVADRKVPVVYWGDERTAFTLAGKRIFVSRRLLEEALPEDAVALLFAHELAHHRLQHVASFEPATQLLARVPGGEVLSVLLRVTLRGFRSPEQECAADDWALERCRSVGYDGHVCLRLFDVLRRVAEDRRDLDMAYGRADVEADAAHELDRAKLSRWANLRRDVGRSFGQRLWARRRGYISLPERRARLAARLQPEGPRRRVG
jgi:hypothetical protein